ncbi:MAG: MdtA/MuxA family multidrug efflux RND transporter periplasmic adaptor subunit [Bradyrhizobiaceae bacterium]|nr:MdtA/MuxA family multidrug efflux RND transporter periplasmic adaptor subunit [Bradyrhizobiaceae bacterium]
MDDNTQLEVKEAPFSPAESPDKAPPDKKRPRGSFRFGWFVIGLGIVAGLVWWIRQAPVPQPSGRAASAGAPMPVVDATVEKGDVDIAFDALGTVTPLATVTVVSQISGQLMRVAYQEGQIVKQGDLLAEIDSRPYELALRNAQGQLERDQALLNNAQLDLARYTTLAAQNAVPKQTLDTTKSLVQQYQGAVITDQATIDTAKLNINYCHITAPVTGRVGLRLIDQGNYISTAATTSLVVITQLQPISVIFTMPEDNLPQVLERLKANATLEASAFDRTFNNRLAVGTLTTLDNQIDTSTGQVKLRAQFTNDDLALFPNQFVNVRLLVDTLHDATLVPGAAIQRGAQGTFVYIVNSSDNTVSVRPVVLGPGSSERVSVRSGLSPGDRVVIDGADKLREGAKIALRREEGGATSATPAPAPAGRQRNRSSGRQ